MDRRRDAEPADSIRATVEILDQLESARWAIDQALGGNGDLAALVRFVLSRACNAACWLPILEEAA